MATAAELLELRVIALEERQDKTDERIGRPGSALGDEGFGLAKNIADLIVAVAALKESFDADRVERAKKREPWSRAAWLAVNALVAALAGGGAHWFLTLHH